MSTPLARRNQLRDAPAWVHALAWGAFALITLSWIVFYFTYRDANVWQHWLGSDGGQKWPTGTETHFYERIYPNSVFRTPANTWSNLGYVLVGLYILAYALYDARRATTQTDPNAVRQPALLAYLGVFCIILGFGSAFMHASLTSEGHWADVFGMFGSIVALIALHWGRWCPTLTVGSYQVRTWPFLVALALSTTLFLMQGLSRSVDMSIMVGLISTIVASFCVDFFLRRSDMQHRWHIFSTLSFAIAFGIWNLTNAKKFTDPDVWYQGHAIWHVLTAFSLGFMAIFYRSEIPRHPEAHTP